MEEKIDKEKIDKGMDCVIDYVVNSRDRNAVSLVCNSWYELDRKTRKHVTISLCYTTTPEKLGKRFRLLKSLKLKGKPTSMFNPVDLLYEPMTLDWGGHATPWVGELATLFPHLNSLHFLEMIVTDADLELLAHSHDWISLKLECCSGFSSAGLCHITHYCRKLKILVLGVRSFPEIGGEWLHELALNNSVLETLDFSCLPAYKLKNVEDLEMIARNCPLVSIKVSGFELLQLNGFFESATALQEFDGRMRWGEPNLKAAFSIIPKLCSVGLSIFRDYDGLRFAFPFAAGLKKLDLLGAFLYSEDLCAVIPCCPNLELFEVRNSIQDRGLKLLGDVCKKLRRIRIEATINAEGYESRGGYVSHEGLFALAQGCPDMEDIFMHVSDITNECLSFMGTRWKKMKNFRLLLLPNEPNEEVLSDCPLDSGIQGLLRGCEKLKRFGLCVRQGSITDVGLRYIGQHSPKVRCMYLCNVGESDTGLFELSMGCPNLENLEMRFTPFSEGALAKAVLNLASLKQIWVEGYHATKDGQDFSAMTRMCWNIELVYPRLGEQVFAYFSLAGQRTDTPASVVPFNPARVLSSSHPHPW